MGKIKNKKYNMNAISCLFLDIGGVLLSNGWDHIFRKQAIEHYHLDPEETEKRHRFMFLSFEEGRMTIDEYLDWVIFYEKRDFTHEQFKEYMFSLSTADFEMIDLIKKLKAQYCLNIIAVSNESRELNAYRIKTFNLNEIFDFYVSSCYVHAMKPDAAIYRMAIDGVQMPLDEIVYIDDVQMFIDVAKKMDITSIHHTDYLSTSKALADLGLPLKQDNTVHE